jgi:hypothetical protein
MTQAADQPPAPPVTSPQQQQAARVMIRTAQLQEMMGLMRELFATGAQAQAWLATVDSGHKVRVRRPLDVVILDEAGSMPEWKMPLLTRFRPRFDAGLPVATPDITYSYRYPL